MSAWQQRLQSKGRVSCGSEMVRVQVWVPYNLAPARSRDSHDHQKAIVGFFLRQCRLAGIEQTAFSLATFYLRLTRILARDGVVPVNEWLPSKLADRAVRRRYNRGDRGYNRAKLRQKYMRLLVRFQLALTRRGQLLLLPLNSLERQASLRLLACPARHQQMPKKICSLVEQIADSQNKDDFENGIFPKGYIPKPENCGRTRRETAASKPRAAGRFCRATQPRMPDAAPGHDVSASGLLFEKRKNPTCQTSHQSGRMHSRRDSVVCGSLAYRKNIFMNAETRKQPLVACLSCISADRQRVLAEARRAGLSLPDRQAAIEAAIQSGEIGASCPHKANRQASLHLLPTKPPNRPTAPCRACRDAAIAAIHSQMASDPAMMRLAVKGADGRGELGADCRHFGRTDEDHRSEVSERARSSAKKVADLLTSLGLDPSKKGPAATKKPHKPPPPLKHADSLMVECQHLTAFLRVRSLRVLGVNLRHLMFAARRMRDISPRPISSAELARRLIGLALECQQEAAQLGVHDPSPTKPEAIAAVLAPRYFAAFGPGNRNWTFFLRGRNDRLK